MLPATDARVFKIAGGNELLPRALLDAARVHLKLGWTVNEVRRLCGFPKAWHCCVAGGCTATAAVPLHSANH
jgi:hypothetical protein